MTVTRKAKLYHNEFVDNLDAVPAAVQEAAHQSVLAALDNDKVEYIANVLVGGVTIQLRTVICPTSEAIALRENHEGEDRQGQYENVPFNPDEIEPDFDEDCSCPECLGLDIYEEDADSHELTFSDDELTVLTALVGGLNPPQARALVDEGRANILNSAGDVLRDLEGDIDDALRGAFFKIIDQYKDNLL